MGTVAIAGRGGLRLAAERRGDADGSVVLFLHGGGQSRSAWRSSARMAADAGFDAWTIDLRGHGDSDWAPDGDYHLVAYRDDLALAIAAIGKPAVLVGASLGGLVATMLAADRSDLVTMLVLADVTPWHGGDGADSIRDFLVSGADGFATEVEAGIALSRLTGTASRPEAGGLTAHLARRDDDRLYWKWDPRFIEDRFVENGEHGGPVVEAARRIRQPTLLIRAEHSKVVHDKHVAAFRALVPHARIVVAPGTQHMVTGDSNAKFGTIALDFISGSRDPA